MISDQNWSEYCCRIKNFKTNIVLKQAIFFIVGEILVRCEFAWFIAYHYRFWLRVAPAANFYFFVQFSY